MAIHLERFPTDDLRRYTVERFRTAADWKCASLLGAPEDLFPLEVNRFPAVVFFDREGTPRAIEEGYSAGQATRYRERAEALLAEKAGDPARAGNGSGSGSGTRSAGPPRAARGRTAR